MGSSFCRPYSKTNWNTILGFGSLLSEKSAKGSFPSLRNFRLAKLRGWKRVFAHPAAIFFERGIARMESREIASLSIEPAHTAAHLDNSNDEKRRLEGEKKEGGFQFIVALFEIPSSEMPHFYEREEEFNVVTVQAEELGKRGEVVRKTNALACSRGTGNSKYYFILLLSCEWNYERGGGAMGVFINLSLIVDTR
mmetsp:Transcript_16111/g.25770  ORF Transcript_16111/g.25770 Transcript_16111/m.25770 type:complete len:195 (-) Transcript_16111:437-1021(-)|eukprot:jgi/Bigna1/63862/fgenesh1_kg.61_\